ncbi:MAG: UDP-N-acetylmuramoyl-L-alanine--D-glutamate ligase, partial [Proteobacteria bacterium]|nr:UDP-N-acetylmuramoyl-L-alanine--D-glutamate ligase [Pseudomonadota bacterium]
MNLKGKKVLVIGFGKTGKAVTQFLLNRQAAVIVNDKRACFDFEDDLDFFEKRGAEFVLEKHPAELFLRPDIIVISPGVDSNLMGLSDARKRGITIMSEIELASRFITVPIIAVTGTNGKTTTTSLISEILQRSGFSVFMGGNIGTPLITFVQEDLQTDFVVVELSSFQLETIERFTPHIAILLNIS